MEARGRCQGGARNLSGRGRVMHNRVAHVRRDMAAHVAIHCGILGVMGVLDVLDIFVTAGLPMTLERELDDSGGVTCPC